MIAWFGALLARIGWRPLAKWAAAVVAVIALEAALHDPFGWRKAKMANLEAAAVSAAADARARTLEVSAERESAARLQAIAKMQAQARGATEALTHEAATAPDAGQPIDAARLARLRAHDAALCAEVPMTGCQGAQP
jgi:hypothetical protein